jgi:hypothetical protein
VLTGGGWTVTPTIDPTTGQIGIALSSNTPIQSAIGGSLVTIDFHEVVGAVVGRISNLSSIALVASARPMASSFPRSWRTPRARSRSLRHRRMTPAHGLTLQPGR